MSEKPEVPAQEQPVVQDEASGLSYLPEGLYQLTPNSRVSVVVVDRATQKRSVEVEFDDTLLHKKLGEKRATAIKAARVAPPKAKRYIEPKGWQRVGDAFIAGPLNPSDEDMKKDEAAPVPAPAHNPCASLNNNLPHGPNLDVPVIVDRRADNVDDISVRISWRYLMTAGGRAETAERLSQLVRRMRIWLWLRIPNVRNTNVGRRIAVLRHEHMLWSRMGTRPYLRLRKYRKHGPPPAREVQWPGMSSLKMPEGYAADPRVLEANADRLKMQAAIDVGTTLGLPASLVALTWTGVHANEEIMKADVESAKRRQEELNRLFAKKDEKRNEDAFEQALEKDSISELDYGFISTVGKSE